MEHAEALERIEIAAAEPDGLDRLMAGDTAEAAAIAGHLAGCPTCVSELARIRRTASVAREVIRSQPDPALRERTLAFVAAAGVARGAAASSGEGAGVAGGAEPVPFPGTPIAVGSAAGAIAPQAPAAPDRAASTPGPRSRRPGRLGWLAAAAAVALLAVGVGYATGGASGAADLAARDRQIAILQETTAATLRVGAQPDARQVALVATPDGGDAAGTLRFSASSGELVAVATGLAPTAQGQEYGCWIEVDGTRTRIGRMYRAGDLWSWAGPVPGLGNIPPGAVFGVSIGPAGGGPDSVAVLTGSL